MLQSLLKHNSGCAEILLSSGIKTNNLDYKDKDLLFIYDFEVLKKPIYHVNDNEDTVLVLNVISNVYISLIVQEKFEDPLTTFLKHDKVMTFFFDKMFS